MVIFVTLGLMCNMRNDDYSINTDEDIDFDMVEGDTSLQDEPDNDPSTEDEVYGEVVETAEVYKKTLF